MLSRIWLRHQADTIAVGDPGSALPLSWARTPVAAPQVQCVSLPISGMTWLAHVDLPVGTTFAQFYERQLQPWPGGVLLRGCAPELAAWLAARGWATARVGIEGRIALGDAAFQRRSIQKMVHAARRDGAVVPIPWSPAAAAQLDALAGEALASRPPLRYLFRQRFMPGMRCFAFIGDAGRWYGALLCSMPSSELAVTELMLRAPAAPAGVVESMFAYAGPRLSAEGVRWLSLNEVPFHHQNDDLAPLERLISFAGRQLYSVYNAPGLLRFKAKFHPTWRPVYLCARPRLAFAALADLFSASGCAELWLSGRRRA